jgi:translation initiation factor 5B
MPAPEQVLRQPVVVVLGHVDSGKCVSGDTIIQLADGRLIEAQTLFETYKTGESIPQPDGVVYEAKGLRALSVDSEGKVVPRSISHLWKLHSDRLVSVSTKAGYVAKTTPEHKFLVMTQSGEAAFVEAEKLRLGDFLLVPSRSSVVQSSLGKIRELILAKLSDDFLVRVTPTLNRRIAAHTRGRRVKFGAELGDRNFLFHVERGYYRASIFRTVVSQLRIPLGEAYDSVMNIKFTSKKRRATHVSPWISLPKSEDEFGSLAYLVGLLYGDGFAGSAHLSNTSAVLISEYRRCLAVAFGVGANQAWRRTAYTVSHKGGKSLARFLAEVFDYPVRDKTRVLHVPEIICLMSDNLVAHFLRGFFDAEGFVEKSKNIGVGCESMTLMKQLPMLLQRFGCLAYHGKKGHGNEIYIAGRNSISAFIAHIGFRDPEKMRTAQNRLSVSQTNRVFEITPVPGGFLRAVRMSNQVIWNKHFQLTSFEAKSRLSKGVLSRVSEVVPAHKNEKLEKILANFSMVQVSGLESSEGDYTVYDFTVDETHNFLANGLIIHNTSLLDKIRGTGVQAREAGGITQEIGASFFPIETLKAISGNLLNKAGAELRVPGLLVIDTPGHEIFSNLRLRGGSAADIAILVVDVLKGLENQTIESVDILKQRKVPFLVALNKIDMIKGWKKDSKGLLAEVIRNQYQDWNDELEERLYNVVGGLSRLGFESDAYYRIKDFRKQVSIVPVSARYGTGIPELLAVLVGLAQQFLRGKLEVTEQGQRSRGIILEKQEEVGVGQTANVILTEGRLRVGDSILLVRREGAIKSKVKGLFMPRPLDEMRDPRDKFTAVNEVVAAAGVKLISADLEGVVPGTPVVTFVSDSDFDAVKSEVEKDMRALVVKTDNMGVIVKAGNIGGLEALIRMLEQRDVAVRLADIGDITKNDIVEAEVVRDHDPYLGAILGFDVKTNPEAKDSAKVAQLFVSNVIYQVIDDYTTWAAKKREEDERTALSAITLPAKIRAIPGAFFRRNDPAVFGVEVMAGKIRPKLRLMDSEGRELGVIEQIQDKGQNLDTAKAGDKVAISVNGPTLGRQVKENDLLYTYPRSHDVKLLRNKFLGSMGQDDLEALEEIVRIRSVSDPMYGF